MKNSHTFRPKATSRAARMLVLSLVSTSMSLSHAGVTLGNSPPVSKQAPEPPPNIILTLDNSGSMKWDIDKDPPGKGYSTYKAPAGKQRIDALKAAAKEAFSEYDDGKFRLAYQLLNLFTATVTSGYTTRETTYYPGFLQTGERTYAQLMKPFEGKHKADFMAWLDAIQADSGTPLRPATIKAGEYVMGWVSPQYYPGYPYKYTYDGKQFSFDPLNGLECRRTVHILMTDGAWNDTRLPSMATAPSYNKLTDWPIREYYNTDLTVQIPTPQTGSLGPNTPIKNYSAPIAAQNSGNIYRSNNGFTMYTLADLAFNYWATDLRADLPNAVKPVISQKGDETITQGAASKTIPEWWNPKNNPATWQNMQTYTIGFGPVAQLPELRKPGTTDAYYSSPNDFMYTGDFYKNLATEAASWGTTITPGGDELDKQYDLWHAAYNGRGKYYPANTKEALRDAFKEILRDTTQPASGGATSSATGAASRLTSDTMAYIASFKAESGVWTGSLEFWKVGDLGVSNATPLVTANVPAAANRSILTSKDGAGIAFQWNAISAGLSETTTPKLSSLNLGNDATVVNGLRAKGLGDVVHSSIAIVGKPSGASLSQGYRDFAAKVTSRTRMVYVGANDGMLHGFDAGAATPASPGSGAEKLAYVPRGLLKDLKSYLAADYAHRYWVDGSPLTGDMQIASQSTENGAGKLNGWRTILAGTLGGGGKGYFILNVTDPTRFTEGNASELVLMDNTDSADADLGHQLHEPVEDMANLAKSGQIVRVNLDSTANPGQKQWAVVMGNGVNSTNGKPVLLVQTLEGDKTLYKVDACKLSSTATTNDNADNCAAKPFSLANETNGLMAPRPVDLNGDGTADVVYAGDYLGNMWKFDITSKNATEWKVGLGGSPLFKAKGLPSKAPVQVANAFAQTITSAPMAVPHPKGGLMVAFGTGRNMTASDQADNNAANQTAYGQRLNTFYGIWDAQKYSIATTKIKIGQTDYYQQQVTLDPNSAVGVDSTLQVPNPLATGSRYANLERRSEGILGTPDSSKLSKGRSDAATMSAGKKGWYYDLPEVAFGNSTKVLQNPWLFRDNVITFFSTNVSSEQTDSAATAKETCSIGTRFTQSLTQVNYFDIFSGANPNIDVYSGAVNLSEGVEGSRYNRFQLDNNPVFLKGSNKIVGTAGGDQEPKFKDRPGRYTGWRIVQ